ncbi:CBS domain-containing protein [Staphylothermus marinus]|nr:CBS domain-containing protein [Staphylothermus marinus]
MVEKLKETRKTRRRDIIDTELISEILDMKINDFIKKYRPPPTIYITVKKGTKLYNVLKAIATGHPVMIIVVDEDRKPIGYLTDYHILSSFARRSRPRSILASFSISQISIPIEKSLDIPVEDLMDKRPPLISLDNKVKDLIRTIRSLGVPAVIIVDKNNIIRGVIDRRFLVKTLLNNLLGEPTMF